MQRLGSTLIRIVKGPTGGFLASLGIAAVLGGVALASPAPPIAAVMDPQTEVIAAAPLGADATSNTALALQVSTATGGVQTEADPSGRGAPVDPTEHGHQPPLSPNDPGRAGGGTSSGGVRSAGAAPAHQDARDDPPPRGGSGHDQGQDKQHLGSGPGDGSQGSNAGQGDPGSGGQSGYKDSGGSGSGGSGGAGSGGSGSGGSGSGQRGDAGGSDIGSGGDSPNGHVTR
jgi:hypothetical protein